MGILRTLKTRLAAALCSAKQSFQRPRIHVWTHNGITMVAADADVALAIQARERVYLTFASASTHEEYKRLKPLLYSLFSDKFPCYSRHGGFVHSMEDLEKIVRHCVVIRTEMDIPNLTKEIVGKEAVTGQILWRLITNGPNEQFRIR